MLRSLLFATSVSLVALSFPALAGPDDPATSGSIARRAENAPGMTAGALPSSLGDHPIADKSAAEPLALVAQTDIDVVPVLKHIASTGARLLELGEAHGLRSVNARSGDQIAPDGEAVVGGPELDLSVDKLMTLASGQVKELGQTHGLRGLYLRNGPEFQVLYVTPDGKATIAGVMWDATGKNLTRDQVSRIDGAIPTMVVEKTARKRSKPRRKRTSCSASSAARSEPTAIRARRGSG